LYYLCELERGSKLKFVCPESFVCYLFVDSWLHSNALLNYISRHIAFHNGFPI